MPNSPDDYKFAFDIEQDSVVTHPESVSEIIVRQPLDVPIQPALQSLDLTKDLLSNLRRQIVEISDGSGAVFEPIGFCAHVGERCIKSLCILNRHLHRRKQPDSSSTEPVS